MGHMSGMKCNDVEIPAKISKGYQNWYPEGQVEELRKVYKQYNIKLSRKQAKRLWDIFKDCNISTLIF